jgi:hypothetical protein
MAEGACAATFIDKRLEARSVVVTQAAHRKRGTENIGMSTPRFMLFVALRGRRTIRDPSKSRGWVEVPMPAGWKRRRLFPAFINELQSAIQ